MEDDPKSEVPEDRDAEIAPPPESVRPEDPVAGDEADLKAERTQVDAE